MRLVVDDLKVLEDEILDPLCILVDHQARQRHRLSPRATRPRAAKRTQVFDAAWNQRHPCWYRGPGRGPEPFSGRAVWKRLGSPQARGAPGRN